MSGGAGGAWPRDATPTSPPPRGVALRGDVRRRAALHTACVRRGGRAGGGGSKMAPCGRVRSRCPGPALLLLLALAARPALAGPPAAALQAGPGLNAAGQPAQGAAPGAAGPRGARGGGGGSGGGWKLSEEAVCREDVVRLCSKHSWANNLAVLECLQDVREVRARPDGEQRAGPGPPSERREPRPHRGAGVRSGAVRGFGLRARRGLRGALRCGRRSAAAGPAGPRPRAAPLGAEELRSCGAGPAGPRPAALRPELAEPRVCFPALLADSGWRRARGAASQRSPQPGIPSRPDVPQGLAVYPASRRGFGRGALAGPAAELSLVQRLPHAHSPAVCSVHVTQPSCCSMAGHFGPLWGGSQLPPAPTQLGYGSLHSCVAPPFFPPRPTCDVYWFSAILARWTFGWCGSSALCWGGS